MNLVLPSLCVVAAGVAGYFLEPDLESKYFPGPPVLAAGDAGKDSTVATVETPADPVPPAETAEIVQVPVDPNPPLPAPEPEPALPPADTASNTPAPEPAGVPAESGLLPPPPPLSGGGDLPGGGSAAAPAGAEAIVELMKQSIRSGDVSEFRMDEVLGWKATGVETFDGETYQTGLAAYRKDTIFGIKTLEVKALIRDGKVVKWIWTKTKAEVK